MTTQRMLIITVLILGHSFLNAQTKNETAATIEPPKSMVLPWLMPGLDAEGRPPKQALVVAQQSLGDLVLEGAVSLTDWARNQKLNMTLNGARKAESILVGAGHRGPKTLPTLGVQPAICYLYGRYVIVVEVFTHDDLVKGYGYAFVEEEAWNQASEQEEGFAPLLQAAVSEAWQSGQNKIVNQLPDNAAKFGLIPARENERQSTVSPQCLTMFAGHGLISKHRIVRYLGRHESDHLWWLLQKQHKSQRALRQMTVLWSVPLKQPDPLAFTGRFRVGEGVFGKMALPYMNGTLSLQEPSTALLEGDVQKWMEGEEANLRFDDLPTVIRVYKAWAYLDRGRGWGLKMDDRLYMRSAEGMVKGHVIGYFGPGHNLKNARGERINEGAILFIRTGQRRVTLGQKFSLDPTAFPTSWPPTPTPAGL